MVRSTMSSHSDVDEYNNMRQHSGAVVTLLDQNRKSVDEVSTRYKQVTIDILYRCKEELDASQETVLKAARVLKGSSRFLENDANKSLKQLDESLGKYKQMVMDILNGKNVTPPKAAATTDATVEKISESGEKISESGK